MWTTAPPAKSRAPRFAIQPSEYQTQCAIGAYTTVTQRTRNTKYVLNLNLSQNAPVISAGVIIANIIWKIANTCSSGVSTPLSAKFESDPI